MCYLGGDGKGVFMGAHTDNAPLEYQVSIGNTSGNANYQRSFTRLFRYGDGGATGYGSSIYVVSALAGNAWRESHINPTLGQGEFAGITSLQEFLTSSITNIPQLTEAFERCWERAGVPALQERIDFAYKACDYIQQHANDSSITIWETEPKYYLSESQALNNAVLMYRFYSAGGGGGGTPSTKKKKMPLWMMIRYY